MELTDRYIWEAEAASGKTIKSGGDLHGCLRFSLIPQAPGLPKHDFIGVPLRKRFCRGFIKTYLADKVTLPGKFFWQNGAREVRVEQDMAGLLSPGDFIGLGVKGAPWYPVTEILPDRVRLLRPYQGNTKKDGFLGRKLTSANRESRIYMHCIETDHSRIWVNYGTGTVLMTPRDYELYL